jgi:cellulose synthase/poly-beta-1,6-N-acetylglucosamine synthase-like glycosyltransferase
MIAWKYSIGTISLLKDDMLILNIVDLRWLLLASAVFVIAHLSIVWWLAFQRGRRATSRFVKSATPPVLAHPSVSVLIPAWKEATTIEACLSRLQQVQYSSWEIIIVAGGPDGTFEKVEHVARSNPQMRVMRQEPGSKNHALSQGLAIAQGEVIVILDADCVVEPLWLIELLGPITQGAAATCGNYLPLRRSWISRSEEMEKIEAYLLEGRCILQGSGSIAVRRDVLDMVGGFPADVLVGVDWDLDARLARAHAQRAFAQRALVWTHRPATLREFWKNEVRWRRAHLLDAWWHRQSLFSDTKNFVNNLSFYVVACATFISILASIGVAGITGQLVSNPLILCTALFLFWIMGRRAALSIAIASYTGDRAWLSLWWAPVVLLFVSMAASLWAVLTLDRQTAHFKGPRPSTLESNSIG